MKTSTAMAYKLSVEFYAVGDLQALGMALYLAMLLDREPWYENTNYMPDTPNELYLVSDWLREQVKQELMSAGA